MLHTATADKLGWGKIKPFRLASLFLCAMLAARAFASERLVYAVTHNNTTEFFSIAPEDTQPTRIFSDASSPVVVAFMPRSGTSAHPDTAVLGKRLFTPGRERNSNSGRMATGIFEFALDGSAQFRKILDLPAGERVDLLTVADDGTKLAYLSLSGTGLTLFVHQLKTGNLLHKIDMLKIAGGCVVRNIGWLPDNARLFFTLEEGPDGFMSDADYKQIGTWLVHEDGTSLTHLPRASGLLHEPGYRSMPDPPPTMLGVVNGRYLFQVLLQNLAATQQLTWALALAEPDSGTSTKIALQTEGVSDFLLSRSGHYIAYTQQAPSKFVGSKHIVPPAHLWVRPLAVGDPKELLSMEIGVESHAFLTLIGWTSE
jgi:hypothetical protein